MGSADATQQHEQQRNNNWKHSKHNNTTITTTTTTTNNNNNNTKRYMMRTRSTNTLTTEVITQTVKPISTTSSSYKSYLCHKGNAHNNKRSPGNIKEAVTPNITSWAWRESLHHDGNPRVTNDTCVWQTQSLLQKRILAPWRKPLCTRWDEKATQTFIQIGFLESWNTRNTTRTCHSWEKHEQLTDRSLVPPSLRIPASAAASKTRFPAYSILVYSNRID